MTTSGKIDTRISGKMDPLVEHWIQRRKLDNIYGEPYVNHVDIYAVLFGQWCGKGTKSAAAALLGPRYMTRPSKKRNLCIPPHPI
jgi:hypothetical protein